jgi:AraC family transcriptional regulator of adaptative response/methylated-DNA-[protein]-cysteine methyltransferase
MTAIGDDQALYELNFGIDDSHPIGSPRPLLMIQKELGLYFQGKLQEFKTPISYPGTPFQIETWQQLLNIPYGQTRSYGEMARLMGKPTHFRAVARANSTNRLAIIIPCHRVINTGGALGGYAGGIDKKQWLLDHEQR